VGSKLKQKSAYYLFLPILLICFIASCVSAGNSKLTEENVGKIVDGKTNRDEVAEILGEPEEVLQLDKESLENYLNRVAISDPAEINFPEDHYEVLIYKRWSHTTSLVLSPSYEEAKVCIIVINSKNICVKKFYAKESNLQF
jgi:hypothetical protein